MWGGEDVQFFLNAWASASSDEDSFRFSYSFDDVNYTNMFTVGDKSYHSFPMPSDTASTVYIRVVDTNRISGTRSLDTIFIDHMFIRSVPVPGSPPAAPSGLEATAVAATQIDLSWNDNSLDEDGFKIERSLDDTTWSEIATVDADVTAYSDTGVSANTTYYYRVLTYNRSGVSQYSNTADALTMDGGISGTMYVDSIVRSLSTKGKNIHAEAQISILDQDGNPVEGANVTGNWYLNGAVFSSEASGTTGSQGVANIPSGRVKGASSDVIKFCVTNVTHTTYDDRVNIENCATR